MPSSAAPEATIGAFDSLSQGDPAPEWLTHSVIVRWGLEQSDARLSLITVSENATFLVSRAATPWAVVRVSRPGYVPSAAHIESELSWVRALADEVDTPVPHVIAARDGSYVQTITDDNGTGWFVVAFAFNSGTILEDDFTDPLPYYERIGGITAEFHLHSHHWSVPEGFTRFSWELEDMVGSSARWGDWHAAALSDHEVATLESAQSAALSIVDGLTKTSRSWGIIHADLRPSNIMVENGALTVIDFDDCGYAWYLYDFASAFSFIEHLPVVPSLAQAWMRGYQKVIPLTEAELSQATALSMIRRLQMLGWTTTHREDALPEDIWQAQVPGTVDVASKYLNNPAWLLTD